MARVHNNHTNSGFSHRFGSVLSWPGHLFERYRNRQKLNGLLSMDDHMLHDIGLQRGDVQREAIRPLWHD
jgi:uncharacterized protein YjiS (DUF1127 family)